MRAAIKSGVAYCAIVFAFGFVLGAIRIMIVVPRAGEFAAVCLESPIMLALSWVAASLCIRRFHVSAELAPRMLMGAIGFICLMVLELGLSILLFGQSLAAHIAAYQSAPGAVGFAAQCAFALIPMARLRRERP